jgi:hypothetical protein
MTECPADLGSPPPAEPPNSAETAEYIAQLSSELSLMARGAGLELLAYLLEMVRIEAAQRAAPPDSDAR